ncbi:MAG: GNAT family N-acetyltransferase [Treponema sp.]|nr:GNAT family N-acetyltransferase [Treponema sp.]
MNYKEIFLKLHPDFFKDPEILNLPDDYVFSELIMDLCQKNCSNLQLTYPKEITFDFYKGDLEKLQQAIAQVDQDWCQFFDKESEVFCAFEGEKIAAFCALDQMGFVDGLKIGGPGCVGTLPQYRKKGIGLELVRRASEILRQQGFDLSWIHWTHLATWYGKLGYELVLQWNCKGFLETLT